MPTYIAFLRAVNLGRNRKLPMADLRRYLEDAGLRGVETYIQTGNVRFDTPEESRAEVERHLEEVLAAACGFDVPAVLFDASELRRLHDDLMRLPVPLAGSGAHGRYVVLFKDRDVPGPDVAEEIAAWSRPGESAAVVGRAVHVSLDGPTMQADFFGAFKKALEPGTNRNLKVVSTLVERWTAERADPGSNG